MRHYEIVFLVHPDQSDQSQSILDKFSSIVLDSGGKVHRLENIGSKKLSYPIQDQFKASYCLLNVECNQIAIGEIKNFFNFNDSIIRELILSRDKAYKDVSSLSSQTEQEEEDPFTDSEDSKEKAKVETSTLDKTKESGNKLKKTQEEFSKEDKEQIVEKDKEESKEEVNQEISKSDRKDEES